MVWLITSLQTSEADIRLLEAKMEYVDGELDRRIRRVEGRLEYSLKFIVDRVCDEPSNR